MIIQIQVGGEVMKYALYRASVHVEHSPIDAQAWKNRVLKYRT